MAITCGEDTLACGLSLAGLAILAVTLSSVWHIGAEAALITVSSGAVLALLLVWARVPSGLSPLLAQCFGAVLCVRLVAAMPLSASHLVVLRGNATAPLTGWLVGLVDQTVGPDRAVFLLLLFLLWEIAYTMVWLVLRERWAWTAGGLGGVSLVAGAGAAGVIGDQSLVFVLVALALVLWTTFVDYASGWRRAGVAVAPGVPPVMLMAGVGAVLVAGALAWAVVTPSHVVASPASSPGERIAQLVQLWQRASRRVALSVSGTLQPAPEIMGQGVPLSLDRPFTPRGSGAVLVSGAVPPDWQAMYWRGAVYDTYAGGTWQPAVGTSHIVAAGTPLQAVVPGQRTVTLRYRLLQASGGSVLVSAGRLLSVDVPALPLRNTTGLLAVRAAGASREYAAFSTWPSRGAGAGILRQAWDAADVAVPRGLESLAPVARAITARAAGPRAQANALQEYLRTSYTYDASVGAPPPGRDPIAYFLTASHRGYCTHFASAMVVLARSLGLPARVVGGYAGGEANRSSVPGVVLRDSDAHTWPEIYLAGRGWTLYEPTPGFTRPGTVPPAPLPVRGSLSPRPAFHPAPPAAVHTRPVSSGEGPSRQQPGLLLPAAELLCLMIVAVMIARRHVQRSRPAAAQVARLYRRMARLVRLPPGPAETAREYARRVAGHDPTVAADALWLGALYERVSYGRMDPSTDDMRQARAALVRLRWLWLRRLVLRQSSPG
ncbi:MAG: hypothetical protein NVSMB65_08240 [Chloroflexota bacterium]